MGFWSNGMKERIKMSISPIKTIDSGPARRSYRLEHRAKEQVINLLKAYGLGRDWDKKWEDYRRAKTIVFEGEFLTPPIYDRQIGWIMEFLKI